MAKLKTVFKAGGTDPTRRTSSQMSDGAGFVLLMAKEKAQELGLVSFCQVCGICRSGRSGKGYGNRSYRGYILKF
jgi:acetyl-CoA acyltransferase